MRARRATAVLLPQMKQLWQLCFGDEAAFIDGYFSHFGAEHSLVITEGAHLCAMAQWLPVEYVQPDGETQQGAYLYALCTHPNDRNRGFCRSLCAFAEEELQKAGCDFLCLRPGDPGLVSMYEKLGYAMTFTNEEREIYGEAQPQTVLEKITPEAYQNYRDLLLQDSFLDWPLQAIQFEAKQGDLLSLSDGGRFGVAAVEVQGEEIHIKEFLGDDSLAGAIPAFYEAEAAVLRIPGQTPFAAAKALTRKPLPQGYPGFVFD